jgi:hypothetical protein
MTEIKRGNGGGAVVVQHDELDGDELLPTVPVPGD